MRMTAMKTEIAILCSKLEELAGVEVAGTTNTTKERRAEGNLYNKEVEVWSVMYYCKRMPTLAAIAHAVMETAMMLKDFEASGQQMMMGMRPVNNDDPYKMLEHKIELVQCEPSSVEVLTKYVEAI